jgi:hypothetical protein
MAKTGEPKMAGGRHLEISFFIPDHDATDQQKANVVKLLEEMKPRILAEVGAAGKEAHIVANCRGKECP